jgi:RNA polymerase sigma factor for flagellar operon FliA
MSTAAPPAEETPDRLVDRYRHLVRYVVRRLGARVVGVFDDEDATQAGMLGLLAARDAYRPDRGASFETYAILRIRGAILDAVRALDPIRRQGREAARAIADTGSALAMSLGRDPTDVEVAERLGMTVERCVELRRIGTIMVVSLEADSGDGAIGRRAGPGDAIADPQAIDPMDRAARKEELTTLVREVAMLGDRKRRVIALYYRDELTFREIARVLGVSESRACQIHRSALHGLRERLSTGAPQVRGNATAG